MRRWIARILRLAIIVVLTAVLLFLLFRYKYRESIRGLAETQIRNATSDLINDAIDKQIETGNIQYDRIVFFEKDLNGRITALKTNMSEVNRLKTDILNIINDEISKKLNQCSPATLVSINKIIDVLLEQEKMLEKESQDE